jgi:hypothetical protein
MFQILLISYNRFLNLGWSTIQYLCTVNSDLIIIVHVRVSTFLEWFLCSSYSAVNLHFKQHSRVNNAPFRATKTSSLEDPSFYRFFFVLQRKWAKSSAEESSPANYKGTQHIFHRRQSVAQQFSCKNTSNFKRPRKRGAANFARISSGRVWHKKWVLI